MEGSNKTVIGVMPSGFWVFPWAKNTDAWLAFRQPAEGEGRWLSPIARLKPGVSIEQAQAEMDTIARRLEQAFPETNTRLGHTGGRAARFCSGRLSDDPLPFDGCGRLCSSDRLRQCREHAPGASCVPAEERSPYGHR